MDKITFVVADITFKVAMITSSVTKIAFVVNEITFKVAVITSSVAKITSVVAEITFEVAMITSSVDKISFLAPCRDFSCNRSHSTPECDEAFSTYLSTPLHATPNCRPLPLISNSAQNCESGTC